MQFPNNSLLSVLTLLYKCNRKMRDFYALCKDHASKTILVSNIKVRLSQQIYVITEVFQSRHNLV